MTLPLRRKLPIIVPNSRPTIPTRPSAKLLVFLTLGAAVLGADQFSGSIAHAQQWQPDRDTNSASEVITNDLRPRSGRDAGAARHLDHAPRPVMSSTEQVGTGMVLRWRSTAPRSTTNSGPAASSSASTLNNTSSFSNNSPSDQRFIAGSGGFVQPASHSRPARLSDYSESEAGNPLRQSRGANYTAENQVRPAAYQQEWTAANSVQYPRWQTVNTQSPQDSVGSAPNVAPVVDGFNQAVPTEPSVPLGLPGAQQPSGFGFQDFPGNLSTPSADALDQAELPPTPPQVVTPSNELPSFPPQIPKEPTPGDSIKEEIELPSPLDADQNEEPSDDKRELLKRAREASTPDCITQRELLRGKPLSSIVLDLPPKLGEGLSKSNDNSDEARAEFEKNSVLRDWNDFKGNLIASGRMVDRRLGNIVLDVGGSRRLIPLSILSDKDMTYVAELWNLPFGCGTGFEPLEGRQFVASTVQYKASNACYNPLYFQQVQLERYGHEVGPVLQPLISSAHFFLSIPMLPYKMGINPPNECQYPLGYYRPGNCAPYMIQPFPWSVRGGLAEAAAIVGGAAIIP